MPDVFDALADAKPIFFSSLDLRGGYHPLLLNPSREITSFITHRGLYQFLKLPFGICSAPAHFSSLMTHLFRGLTYKTVLCYLHDILVFNTNFESHLKHLDEVFTRLRSAKLILLPKICSFALPKIV